MTTTYKIKAYSRTTNEEDATKMSKFEYNGSLQATAFEIGLAFNNQDRGILRDWSAALDCFYDVIFIRADTDEMVAFNKYDPAHNDH